MRVALVKLAAKVMKLANAISGSIPGKPCGMPNSKAMPSGVMLEVTPVSYTHLDVYKRQQYFDENGKAIGKTDFQKKYAKTAYQNDEVNPNFVKISDHAAIEELYMYTRTLDTTAGKNITCLLYTSRCV